MAVEVILFGVEGVRVHAGASHIPSAAAKLSTFHITLGISYNVLSDRPSFRVPSTSFSTSSPVISNDPSILGKTNLSSTHR